MSGPVSAYLVCGGKWHDFDFARVDYATDGSTGLRLEASRRIVDNWTASLEGQAFLFGDRASPAGGLADDHSLRLKVTYFFGTE